MERSSFVVIRRCAAILQESKVRRIPIAHMEALFTSDMESWPNT
jgi:hypothetical protein